MTEPVIQRLGGPAAWKGANLLTQRDWIRPLGGMAVINFAQNEGNDYRFEVFRDCGAQAYGQGLASEFGANSPPLLEWSFNDIDLGEEQAAYVDNVFWPSSVWVRVVRFANDGECSSYQLQVMRN